MSGPRGIVLDVPPDAAGLRLDQILAKCIEGFSRRQARTLIDIGGVFVDGTRVKIAGRTLRAGQRIQATIGDALERATKAPGRDARARDDATLPSFEIAHEDDDLIVVDKPSGLLVAPTAESDRGNLLALLAGRAGFDRVYLVHRIDCPASGLVVYAKTPAAVAGLSRQFAAHTVDREYLVVVRGEFPRDCTTCTHAIGGRRAITHFQVDEAYGDTATRLRCRLETGRTHQIRIHTKVCGHPVMGDRVHGVHCDDDPSRLALHAASLGFVHPRTGKQVRYTSVWPRDLAAWTDRLPLRAAGHRDRDGDLPSGPTAA